MRVCLDEGHNIKNHLAKTAKAAARLDTKRKWIISGTPIQNNLVELWALLQWLGETKYGLDRKVYNYEIIRPINDGRMSGYYRYFSIHIIYPRIVLILGQKGIELLQKLHWGLIK